MKFSVLMSVYYKENASHFDTALRSILIDQTVIPNEFVLVCDGELTEELNEVISFYLNQFSSILKVCRIEKNVGLGRALKFGLEQCTYEYVARADSDDICHERRFEKQLEYLKKHPEVDVLGTDILEVGFSKNDIKSYKKMPSKHSDIVKMAKTRNPINHMTVFMKKSVVLKVGSYEHLQSVEDYFLWLKLIVHGAIFSNINEPLVYARIGNGMIERRGNKQYIQGWKFINKYKKEHKIINVLEYFINMISIRIFIYMPASLKRIMYKFLLRK